VAIVTLFADADSADLAASADPGSVNLSLGFYVLGVSGYEVRGIRFYIPAGTVGLPASGHLGYIYGSTGSPPTTASTVLAACTFTGAAAGQWNEATLNTPVVLTAGQIYWASVYFPSGLYGAQLHTFGFGATTSPVDSALHGADAYAVSPAPGNGRFTYGAAGTIPSTGTENWYGIDVLVDDGTSDTSGSSAAEAISITDSISGTRSGLPSTITATATATDTLNANAVATQSLAVGTGTTPRTVQSSFMGNKLIFGSAIDTSRPQGPSFVQEPSGGITLGLQFTALRNFRIASTRIYKAPLANGTITVSVWTSAGVKLSETTTTWSSDTGGWREIVFPEPADVAQDSAYMVSYHVPSGHFSTTTWVYNAMPTVGYPFYVTDFQGADVPAAFLASSVPGFPNTRTASSFWIDPIAEWEDPMPGYTSGSSYYDQWTNGGSSFAFPVGVFFADPEFLADYMSVGVNTLIAAPASPIYIETIKDVGMDVYADVAVLDLTPPFVAAEDAEFAARLKGYFVVDEPDLIETPTEGFRSPTMMRTWIDAVREIDTTRPCIINLGKIPPLTQVFYYKPTGATLLQASQYWREWAAMSDIMSCDFYNMTSDQDEGRYGIWTYPAITRVMRSLSDGTKPVWGYVETTAQVPNEPTPTQVYRATWAHLIAGARGIVFFDHRFANSLVTQDFAALLHNTPMRAQIQSLTAQLQTLGPALLANEADLVSSIDSSGTLLSAKGGLAAGSKIPIHYTTRVVGANHYIFAQSIRPGSTTGTFTVPDAANTTLTVIGEGRTVDTDDNGVFVDLFSSDYVVHLYSWTTTDVGGGGGDGGGGTITFTHDPSYVGPSYYSQWSQGPPTDMTYFPIMAYHMNLEQWTTLPQQLADSGINGIDWGYDDPGQGNLNIAHARGWHCFINYGGDVDTGHTNTDVVHGYVMFDEPNQTGSPYDPLGTSGATDPTGHAYAADVATQQAADPNRPVTGNFTKDIMDYAFPPSGWTNAQWTAHMSRMLGALDIVVADIYAWTDPFEWDQQTTPFPTNTHYGAWIYGLTIRRLRGYNPTAPAFAMVEVTDNYAGSGPPNNTATPEMIETAMWQIIVNGGRGIVIWPRDFYFEDDVFEPGASFIGEASLWGDQTWRPQRARLTSVAAKIHQQATAINSPTVLGCSATGAGGVPVDVLGKDVTGKLWMLVQASGNESHQFSNTSSMTATITVPSVVPAGTVFDVLDEARTVTVNSSHQFTDTFGTTTETPLLSDVSLTYGYKHHIYVQQ
jgi:hypothetical protein